MVTFTGMQKNFEDALKDLLELEYDATEAYTASIERLENDEYIAVLKEFRDDHKRHISEITDLLKSCKHAAPDGPDYTKKWLAKGKVMIANLVGDKAILSAMASNEEDTNKAYERMHNREDIWEEAKDLIDRAFEDEKRHKKWLESA